ncbi:MAG: DUF3078 domain-containing protein [Bacteroidales bacterium]|nr:DUF3078 domain-containing protein [Bacteroidales bacterium]
MKKIAVFFAGMLVAALPAFAQDDAQQAAAQAAETIAAAPDVPVVPPKPKYWTLTLQNNINFGQTFLSQWAAGGYNNYSLAAGIDANANYAKGKMIWNNRLQLDYGFMYSADKPIIQKNKDRIYFESKWGLETPAPHLSWSANFDFRTQFNNNWNYATPKSFAGDEPTKQEWKAARELKSGLFSPAYINLGLGLLWTPKPWFSLNFAPITGGVVIVSDDLLRYTYGMDLVKGSSYTDRKQAYTDGFYSDFRPVRYEFGAQLKIDAKWVINENFTYTTQLALFYNYLTPKVEPRINWDNKVFWKMAKYFALTLSTNLIYDPLVMVRDSDKDGKPDTKGVQFREFLELGFTYTISAKK